MPEARRVTAFQNHGGVCVSLGSDCDFQNALLMKWCVAVAGAFKPQPVSFQTAVQRVVHTGDTEAPAPDLLDLTDVSWSPAGEFYTPSGLSDLIERENDNAREMLVAQLRSPMGVVPFVGAGLSVDFGFPGWQKFLTDAAEFHSDPAAVLQLVSENKFIEAATRLAESPDRFQLVVEKSFGRQVSEEQARQGAAVYLSRLATGPVITTNFDRVLEAVFQAAGNPFEELITGGEPDNVIRAMHRNKHVLIKMHGDALDRSARVFTGLEYEKGYRTISRLAHVMFTNRPLLFLGSSLDKDRTLEVLENIHKELPGLVHYAVLSASYNIAELRKRRAELDEVGVSPLWYAPGDYKSIERILAELIHDASTRLVWKPKKADISSPLKNSMPSSVPPSLFQTVPGSIPGMTEVHRLLARRLARRVVNGRLAFFLGAGAHLNRELSARAFYRAIAKEHGIEESELQRAEAAQFIVDSEGRADAWISAKERLPNSDTQASVVYHFLAQLPKLLRNLGKNDAAVLWMLTTNYDTMLEEVFEEALEPFHLLYYQVDGKDAGRCLHRDPDGVIRVIERPQHVCSFRDGAHLIVRLDGGIPYDLHFNETVAISPMDFAISAGRLPTALPEAVRRVLRDRSLLILGSSLKDQHVQSLIRWSAGTARGTKTWAVGLGWTETDERFWSAAGVELVNCDFKAFIPALHQEVIASYST